ncbi:MAG: MBOAT family O-acyltransferase [Pseudomonadota bacterium]
MLLYLPLVLAVYFLLPDRFRNGFLFIASLIFYAWGEGRLVIVMVYAIAVAWYFGQRVAAATSPATRKLFLTTGICLTLLPLLYFKYTNFIVQNLNTILIYAGLPAKGNPGIALPIGISFFTFQALSYLIDVFRRTTAPQKSLLNLGLYVALFPQLIAGPIVRYKDISQQITRRHVSVRDFVSGAERFVYGLGKKVLIANPLGEMADRIFGFSGGDLTTGAAWLGILCYSFQIYFDFSGYSSMAIGLGRMFGFRFLENFNYPYIASSIRDFWRRWHISLSNWFRDYLYIPLGGNRVPHYRIAFNLTVVFVLCGLWHGAAWNFLIWGLFHGGLLILERGYFGELLDRMLAPLRHLYVLLMIMIGWVFFRSETVSGALDYLQTMSQLTGTWDLPPALAIRFDDEIRTVFYIAIILSTPIYRHILDRVEQISGAASGLVGNSLECLRYSAAIGILALSVLAIAAGSYNPFIYFRF